MNQYPFINPIYIIEELKKIDKRLSTIEELLKEKKNNYLEKDDNYYII